MEQFTFFPQASCFLRSSRYLATAVVLMACAGIAVPQSKASLTASEVLERVRDKYARVDDASAEFTQKVSLKYAKIEQTFSGTVAMKKGNKYRIESEQQSIVTDGTTVWVYSPVNKQVLIDSYKERSTSFSPEKFLLGLPRNFLATLVAADAAGPHTSYVLKLSPKAEASKVVKSLKVWVDDSDWSVRYLDYVDLNETRTTYSLKGIHFNTGIPDDRFVFVVPDHVEVVDLRTSEHSTPHE